jgi:SNF2 family DNA or RNA helicase
MGVRDKIVKDFQEKDLDILLAQTAVADCGLNLSSAKTLYFHNLPWSLGTFIQFLSRPLNVMKKEVTNVVIPYFKGTIEEGMLSTLVRKAENFESLLDKLDDSEEDGGLSKELNIAKEFARDYWQELMGEVQNRK